MYRPAERALTMKQLKRMRDGIMFRKIRAVFVYMFLCGCLGMAVAQQQVQAAKQGDFYILQNAYVTATVSRFTGDLVSLKYNGLEMMDSARNHGYWEQNPSRADNLTDGISIDPATNGGSRAEVFVRGKANGKTLAGTSSGGMVCDLEIRYSLGSEDRGIYTYAIFSHPANYPATDVGESRFAMKLNGEVFDWMSVDPQHNYLIPSGNDWKTGQQMNMKEARKILSGPFAGKVEHKYDYSSDQFDSRAFGWSSTKNHVGIFLINPSNEYMSGGPTKVELTCHLGDDGPIVLDYWRSTHYGGSTLDLRAGEAWSKTVGPIYIYVNSGPTPDAIFNNARYEAKMQAGKWPFNWVRNADYPIAEERSQVSGRIQVQDSYLGAIAPSRMLVGLIPPEESDGSWQTDAKNYQFWVYAQPDGSFTIPAIRPGTYAVHALADGVFGEYSGAKVKVVAGHPLDLGSMTWTPVRYGRPLWDIGIPNRSGSEFFMGDRSNHWGMYLLYAKLFPKDIDYTIGKSDYRKDWYFEQVPNIAHGGDASRMMGAETDWKIHFHLDAPVHGKAIFRTGICGVGTRHVFVVVNGKHVGDLAPLTYNATINRDGIQGEWTEHDLSFPANILKAGDNELVLQIPGGNAMSGVIYDYLRLELDETGKYTDRAPSVEMERKDAPEPE